MDVRPRDSHWPTDLPPVAIIGAGESGLAVAELALHFGYPTRIVDTDPKALERAQDRVGDRLRRRDRKGLLQTDVEDFLEGLETTDDLEAAAGDAEVVVEALPEELELKQNAFNKLSDIATDAILGTDTSLFAVGDVARDSPGADRILGTHFYGIGRDRPLVEIIKADGTGEDAIDRGKRFVRGVGKPFTVVEGDGPGFVVTRVLSRLLHRCAEVAEDENPAEIDAGFRELGFGAGPFELMDAIGLDRIAEVAEALDGEVPDTVQELVEDNKLGRKTREGWYGPSGPPEDADPADPWELMPEFLVEAAEVVDEGFASPEKVDKLLRLGGRVPGGPFQLIHRKGLDEVVELAEDAEVDASPLESVELSEEHRGVEVAEAGDITMVTFTHGHNGNRVPEDTMEAFASEIWDIDGPLIVTGEGEYFLHPEQERFPDDTLDELRVKESVAVLHGPMGEGAMSVARACRRRVARVDAAIGIDRPVPASRAVQLELVDAVAHPLWLDKAVASVMESVHTSAGEDRIHDLLYP
jgi:enoyl-CoA hydratase/3-hydroxyacyl-CoA dehydrogenase